MYMTNTGPGAAMVDGELQQHEPVYNSINITKKVTIAGIDAQNQELVNVCMTSHPSRSQATPKLEHVSKDE